MLKGSDKTGGVWKGLQANVKRFTSSALGIATAIGAGTVAAVAFAKKAAAAYTQAINSAARYQKAVYEINTLLNASDAQVKTMSKDLQDLAVRFGQVDTVMARAQYNVVSAGFNDVADSMEILTVASKAAIGGISDVNTAARVITQTLNAYGKSASDAEEVAGVLFATVKGGVTTFEELAGYLGKVTASAAVAGISFEEVAAAMAVMTKNGINTAEAATALNSLIIALGAATGESKDKLDALGINLDKGLAAALTAVNESGGDSLMTLREMVPNVRALKAAASAGADGARAMKEQLVAMTDGVQNFNDAYRIMSETLDLANSRLAAAKSRLQTAAGNTGVAGATAAVEGMTEAVNELAVGVEDGTTNLTRYNTQLGQIAGWLVSGTTAGDGFLVKVLDIQLALLPMVRRTAELHAVLSLLGVDFKNAAQEAVDAEKKMENLKQFGPTPFNGPQPDPSSYFKRLAPVPFVGAEVNPETYFKKSLDAAEATAAQSARRALEAAAKAWGVATKKPVFDPAKLEWFDVDIAADDLAEAIGEAYKKAVETEIPDAPVIPRETLAADTDREPLYNVDDVLFLEEIMELEKERALQLGLFSDEELAAMAAEEEARARRLEAAREELKLLDKKTEAQLEYEDIVKSVGANFERMLSNSLSMLYKQNEGALMFGRTLRYVVLDALAAVLAKMIAIKAVELFTNPVGAVSSGLGLFARGGTVPHAATGFAVPDGPRGMDSRLVMAMPGEEIIRRSLSQRLDRFLVASESAAMASPFDIDSGGGRGGVRVSMQVARPMSYLDSLDLGEAAAVAARTVKESYL